MSSELGRWNRWDAGFHVHNSHFGKAAELLEKTYGPRGLRRLAKTLPRDQKLIRSLARDQRKGAGPPWQLEGRELSLYVAVGLNPDKKRELGGRVLAEHLHRRANRVAKAEQLRAKLLEHAAKLMEKTP